ncbi:hypothetical protein CWI84_02575 [Idiomarina tyrosinivorans]|mgnify:FL=1|jgi:hypothetical protein|uniref:Uncharacterized protein n=2 Tax=Gammaproteobacteria TaxID=1236 RepID=A0A432ZSY7_9GAMM|nr:MULTISPECIES: hypothetical protein [Gammaproteobacteria]NWN90405.1 hypothetical protein [Marinobacter adhaerens]RUO81017.1 hypothetical protein CWI84_02575 [Idiomarina tyrosinivorans]|tara:strand:- start:12028 stop:12315 length:288 start_codon:yes stop_codon:yes gene_type:complete
MKREAVAVIDKIIGHAEAGEFMAPCGEKMRMRIYAHRENMRSIILTNALLEKLAKKAGVRAFEMKIAALSVRLPIGRRYDTRRLAGKGIEILLTR